MKITISVLLAALSLAAFGVQAQTTGTTTPNDPTSMPEPGMLKMDKDGDGKISRKEADRRIARNWDKWDINRDGMIDSAEYAAGGSANASSKETQKY